MHYYKTVLDISIRKKNPTELKLANSTRAFEKNFHKMYTALKYQVLYHLW